MRNKSIIWTISKDKLQEMCNTCSSYKDILLLLGYSSCTGVGEMLKKRIEKDCIDTKTLELNRINNRHCILRKVRYQYDNKDVFISDSKCCRGSVKRHIIKNNLMDYKCEKCGIGDMWEGEKISLQLDHKNGVNNDNRLENLRFLCPNCHSQTHTFSGRNTRKEKAIKVKESADEKENRYKTLMRFQVSFEELKNDVENMPLTDIAKKYKVSDTAIRKRCKAYGIELKGRGYWSKNIKHSPMV